LVAHMRRVRRAFLSPSPRAEPTAQELGPL